VSQSDRIILDRGPFERARRSESCDLGVRPDGDKVFSVVIL